MTQIALEHHLDDLSPIELMIRAGTWEQELQRLSTQELLRLKYDWHMWARRNQRVPPSMGHQHRIWMFRAGRGSGKTRAGAEATRQAVQRVGRIALVAPTAADVRDVIIEGDSGILSVFPRDERPFYQPSIRKLTFHTGAVAFTYSAEEPERLRGPQHGWAWIDEPASMPKGQQTLDNLLFGLRLGTQPWVMITGTPKPLYWLRSLAERPETVTTTGSTYQNVVHLAPGFIQDVLVRYEGTRLGRQELYAEWLDDVEGALFTEPIIDKYRLAEWDQAKPWEMLNEHLEGNNWPSVKDRRAWKIVVAVDPPGETAECGIVVATAPVQGRAGRDHAVVLEDASLAGRPEEWGQRVAAVAEKWNAERVIVESNQGGDMVRATIHAVSPNVRVEKIRASVSKYARAEPVSALYEKGFVHHAGFMPMLESQMISWVPSLSKSPDRMDALVYAVSHLLQQSATTARVVSAASRRI